MARQSNRALAAVEPAIMNELAATMQALSTSGSLLDAHRSVVSRFSVQQLIFEITAPEKHTSHMSRADITK